MWGAATSHLALPPLPAESEVVIALRTAPGPDSVSLVLDGEGLATVDGGSDEQRLWFRVPSTSANRVSRLVLGRRQGYPPGGGDTRPLAVQLFEIRALSESVSWASAIVHTWQREALRIELEGAYDGEHFAAVGEGVWLRPRAVLRLPAAPGRLRLKMWAPRPTPPRTEIIVAGRHAAGPFEVGHLPSDYWLDVLPADTADGRLELEIRSNVYRPADSGSGDSRELGVVISELAFEPLEPGS